MNNKNKPTPHPHAELIKAWADGAKIQFKDEEGVWREMPNPDWDVTVEYRIKPSNEPWKPKEGDEYFYVDECAMVDSDIWGRSPNDVDRYTIGNCFRTVKEAEYAVERVKAALKGATDVSANVGSNVGSNVDSPEIDGKPLSDGEKALIRAFRKGRLCRQFSSVGSVIVEGHDKVPCGVATRRDFVAFFMRTPMQDSEVRNALEKIKAEQEAKNEAE